VFAAHEVPRKVTRHPQLAKQPLITGSNGPNFNNRIWAKLIDFALIHCACALGSWFWGPALLPLELLLWSRVECAGRGQSPGKWLLGLHTIEVSKGRAIGTYNSLIRNLPFAVISFAFLWNSVFSWALLAVGMLVIAVEAFFIYRLKTGVRVGDIVSNSRVFDYKDEHTLFIERFLKDDT